MWVVKLGGSLQNNKVLTQWLDALAEYGLGRVVIVPGGGKFADEVRLAQEHWNFDDEIAHQMAVLAMQQFGLMLSGLDSRLTTVSALDRVRSLIKTSQIPVWLPDSAILDQNGIPASWDITSDSIAAWLAKRLKAEQLILVKSGEIGSGKVLVEDLVGQGIVDKAFGRVIRDVGFTIRLFGADQVDCFVRGLRGEKDGGGLVVRNSNRSRL